MPALIAILVAKVTGQGYEPISMVWLRFSALMRALLKTST